MFGVKAKQTVCIHRIETDILNERQPVDAHGVWFTHRSVGVHYPNGVDASHGSLRAAPSPRAQNSSPLAVIRAFATGGPAIAPIMPLSLELPARVPRATHTRAG